MVLLGSAGLAGVDVVRALLDRVTVEPDQGATHGDQAGYEGDPDHAATSVAQS
jgi:hypothetical protein